MAKHSAFSWVSSTSTITRIYRVAETWRTVTIEFVVFFQLDITRDVIHLGTSELKKDPGIPRLPDLKLRIKTNENQHALVRLSGPLYDFSFL